MFLLVKSSFLLIGLTWSGWSFASDFEIYSKFRNERFEITFHQRDELRGNATLVSDGNSQEIKYEFNDDHDISFTPSSNSRLPLEFGIRWFFRNDNSIFASGDGRFELAGVFGNTVFVTQDGFLQLDFGYAGNDGSGTVHINRGGEKRSGEFILQNGAITIPWNHSAEIAQPLILSESGTTLTTLDNRLEMLRTKISFRQPASVNNVIDSFGNNNTKKTLIKRTCDGSCQTTGPGFTCTYFYSDGSREHSTVRQCK